MQALAFRWKPDNALPSTKPTSYDYPAPDVSPKKRKRHKDAGDGAARLSAKIE